MSNISEQNGRQLSTEQAAPPTDPRTRGLRAVPPTPEPQRTDRICRDFVWGICSMNDACKYRHELDYESMRSILKFCHDYQNRTGCTRPECTYLHASREEENLFLTNGVIPRVLVERYASMSVPSEPAPEPQQPQMMYVNEYITQPPPPPPPPNAHPAPASLSAHMSAPAVAPQMMSQMSAPQMSNMHPKITPTPLCNMMPAPARQVEQTSHSLTVKTNLHTVLPAMSAPLPSLLAPPPPPPPPPPPSLTTAPTQMSTPIYSVTQPMQQAVPALYPVAPPRPQLQPAPAQYSLPAIYDPRRPPPPIPVKRPATAEPEAGPSKVMKSDDSVDNICDTCIEQNLRAALELEELEKLQREEERRQRIFDQKTEDYENGIMVLRSLLSPSLFRVVNEFLDISASTTDLPSSSTSPTYINSSAATIPKQLLFQLMEYLISKRNTDQLTSPLELLTRRSTSQTELMFASILELIQNGVASENRLSALDGIGSNGLGRLGSGSLDRLGGSSLDRLGSSPLDRLGSSPLDRLGSNSLDRLGSSPLDRLGGSSLDRLGSSSLDRLGSSSLDRLGGGSSLERLSGSSLERLGSNSLERLGSNSLERLGSNSLERLGSNSLELAPRFAPAVPRYPASVPFVPTNSEVVVPPTVPYQPDPVPPPPVYAPYQAAAAPGPAHVPPPRPFYHPYPTTGVNNSNMNNLSSVPYSGSAPAPSAQPPQPYQYFARMPHNYYPPFQ